MNLRRHLLTFFIFLTLVCLKVSHAQTTIPAGTPIQNIDVPRGPTPSGPAIPPNGQTVQTQAAKEDPTKNMYSEYQSYCRMNDVDEKAPATTAQKKKYIEDLRSRAKADSQNIALTTELIVENIRQFHFREADDLFIKIKERLSPQELVLTSAVIDTEKKAYRAAATKLEDYLTQHPKDKTVLMALANVYKLHGNYYEAKAAFSDLARMFKKDDFSLELCEIYALDSNHKDTEETCILAAKRNPDSPLPWVFLGISYREQERYKEAMDSFQKSIRLRPTEFAYTCIGEVYTLKNDPQNALSAFKQATEVFKYSPRAELGLALANVQLKRYAEALENFKIICRIGKRETLDMRKTQKLLIDLKSPLAESYFKEVLRCQDDKN